MWYTSEEIKLDCRAMRVCCQFALQRHARYVEEMERKNLAEALLEREKAIFKRRLAALQPVLMFICEDTIRMVTTA